MYKIYINETPLYLINHEKINDPIFNKEDILKAIYRGRKKSLLNYIDLMEKTHRYDAVVIYCENISKLIADFESLYKILDAAGGIVENAAGKTLMIFRRNHWDMAKGKVEKGETIEEAAVREVQEETGLVHIALGDLLHTTLHTYKNKKGKRIIKRSYWYEMTTTDEKLVPQTEEDIEEAIWVDIEAFLAEPKVIYKNILEVIQKKREKI